MNIFFFNLQTLCHAQKKKVLQILHLFISLVYFQCLIKKYLFLCVFAAVTEGAGLLPDGPLQKAVGDSVRFNTSNTPTETLILTVTWKFKGENIFVATPANNKTTPGYEDRIIYFPSTASLELRNLLTNDSGEYKVEIISSTGATDEGSTTLEVLEAVSGVTVSPNSPVEGTPVNLTCDASGFIDTRKWMKGSSDLTLTDNMTLYDNDKVLSFNVVNKKDTGEYKCNISNPVSSMEAKLLFVVNYGPENVEITGESEVKEGSPIKLSCVAKSVPDAFYSWLLNGTLIYNDSKEFLKNSAGHSDRGEYTCKTWNKITEKTSFAVLRLSVTGTKKTQADDNELNYADIKSFQRKNGERVQLGSQDTTTQYSEVKVNNNPSTSSPPTYDVHMQRINKPTPQPPQTSFFVVQ
uniref:Ig-like domain-containing protein n=1 Tax=Gouania willdenowi TaxID=441366 RepID=A0A8C5EDW6_GOUWI